MNFGEDIGFQSKYYFKKVEGIFYEISLKNPMKLNLKFVFKMFSPKEPNLKSTKNEALGRG